MNSATNFRRRRTHNGRPVGAPFHRSRLGDALSTSLEVLEQEHAVEDIKGWRSRSGMERSSFYIGRTSGPAELTDETAHAAPRRSVVLRGAGIVKILHFEVNILRPMPRVKSAFGSRLRATQIAEAE